MLQDKVALITGSTSGIGLGIANALADQGCRIVLNGLGDAAEIERVRVDLSARHGVDVRYDGADLMNPDAITTLVDDAVEAFGGIDILVNNAGIQHTAPIEDFPAPTWDAIIALMLSAPFHLIRQIVPGMKDRNWGRIINISSVHGLVASIDKAAYVSAKHGLMGLTKVVALETARTGVTCNAINPGFVRTELIERQIHDRAASLGVSEEEAIETLLGEKQPSKQFVTVEQLGQVAVFLCSDVASQITGIPMPVDGGWTAQ
jgi:3-hydroxybutyrate dehydrogenase